jgi:hypothetical protein
VPYLWLAIFTYDLHHRNHCCKVVFPKIATNASEKEDGACHSKKNEESKPPSSVKEAVSKGLLKADAIQSTYDDMAEEYLEMIKADESNEEAIGPTHVALKKVCHHIFDHVEKGLLVDAGCGPGTNLLLACKAGGVYPNRPSASFSRSGLIARNDKACKEGIAK